MTTTHTRDLPAALTLQPNEVYVLYGIPTSTLACLCQHPDPEKRLPSLLIPGGRCQKGIRLIDHYQLKKWLRKWKAGASTKVGERPSQTRQPAVCMQAHASDSSSAQHSERDSSENGSLRDGESLEHFIERWLASRKHVAAPKSWLNQTSVMDDFRRWLGKHQESLLSSITPRRIAEFRDAELARGKAATTVNKAISFLQQFFEDAVIQGLIATNPVRGLRLKRARRYAQKRQPFSFAQFEQLVSRTHPDQKGTHGGPTHPDWQTFIIVAGYTGGRQQEVARLTWDRVDFARGKLGLVRSKSGGDVHWVPMHPSLREHLEAKAQKTKPNASDFVMPGFATAQGRYMSKAFRELILPRIGIAQPYSTRSDTSKVGRRLAQYSIHSFRHSLSTWLGEAGVPDVVRMQLTGHEDEEVSRGYTHISFEAARDQLAKLPQLKILER